MSTALNLVSEMERIADALASEQAGPAQISLSSVAEKIARSLGVRSDEVAILAVSRRRRHLHFLVPEALKKVGFIPLSSNSALAARTARDSRPEIDNNFPAARHATVFEGVKINAEPAEAIQKMLSAPILYKSLRFASRSASCFSTSRTNDSSFSKRSSSIHICRQRTAPRL